jgi:D-alanyl-D-alanine carboxypeptidase (penicillin-binding protein 5/6)
MLAAAVTAAALWASLGGASVAHAAGEPACPSAVTAPSAIVIEISTQAVACAKHPDQRRPIASTTKLMTALLTLERAKLSQSFRTSSYRPSPGESVIGLRPGERMKVRDLLRGLLVYSGNDAAMALAQGVGGSTKHFVRLMNRRAKQLGLTNTHYANPIGLDAPGNYSSARDLVRLARVLRTNAFFREVVDSPTITLKSGSRPRTFRNRIYTLLHGYAWINGIKTGHTRQAGYVLVGSGRRHGVQVLSAVLGTPNESQRDAQSLALLSTGTRAFQRITAIKEGQHVRGVKRIPIRYRTGAGLQIVAGETVHAIVRRGQRKTVVIRPVSLPAEVSGPIARGDKIGSADVLRDGKRMGSIPLVAAESIPAAGLGQRTKSWFTRPLAVVLAFAVLGGTVLLAQRRRTRSRDRSAREATAA